MVSNPDTDAVGPNEFGQTAILERTLEKSASCREAFVKREVQPTLEELANEFGVPRSTVGYWSASQSWSALRSAHQQTKRDAESVLAQAAQRVNQPVVDAITSAILALMQGVTRTIQDIDHEKAPSSRATILNTCSFAIKNTSDACKNLGIVGMPKALKEVAESSGGWTAGLTQQINIMLSKEGQNSTPTQAQPVETDETPLG